MHVPYAYSIAVACLVAAGIWVYSAITKDDRNAGRAAKAKAAKEEADRVEAGRKANERANFKLDVAMVINELVANPDWLRGRRGGGGVYRVGFEDLRVFIERGRRGSHLAEHVSQLEGIITAQGRTIRELKEQQKEILKALSMGHPLDM